MEHVSIKADSTRLLWLLAAAFALAASPDESRSLTPAIRHPALLLQRQASALEKLQQRALQEGESGKTDEAIQDYRQALLLQPEWKEGRWNLGSLEYGSGRYDEARATFTEVVQFAPNLGMAWALLGLSEFEVKQYEEARTHLKKAQSLGIQDDAEIARVSAYHLALLMIRAGDFEEAQSLLFATFGSNPMIAQVTFALGLVALRIPLLPDEIDPGQDALIVSIGESIEAGPSGLPQFAQQLKAHPDVPYLHYAYALALAGAGQSKDAIVQFHQETQISPQSPLPWIELSRLQISTATEASLSARKAVSLAPDSREAHEALAHAGKAAGDSKLAEAESQSARGLAPWPPIEDRIVKHYAGHRKADSDTAEQSMQQAMQEYGAARYAAASQHLREWLQSHPGDGTAFAMLGLCEFALKDYDNARIHLDQGAQLGLNGSPQSIQAAKYTFGILLIHAGDFDRATEVLVSASAGAAQDSKTKYALGLALLRKPLLPDQSERDPKLIAAAGEISSLLQQSRYDEAFPQFKQLLAEYPNTSFLHYAYGTALLALSEFDEATAQMQAEITLSPRSELPLLRLASIALRQHRPDHAIEWSQRALDLIGNQTHNQAHGSLEAHYLLGRAWLEKGDNNAAIRELEIAGKLSPNSPEIHFNLAKAYDRAKLPLKADLERATFARLNAASEKERSQRGSQIYSGPHDAGAVIGPPSVAGPVTDAAPSSKPHMP